MRAASTGAEARLASSRLSHASIIIHTVNSQMANGVLPNFLVESSLSTLLLRICIFYMGAPLSRVFAYMYQTNESTPLLLVRLANTQKRSTPTRLYT